jgi:predicted transcriptional regulator
MPMEIKINMDEKSGKITNISFNGDLNSDAVGQAMQYMKNMLDQNDQNRGAQKLSVMAKDIDDLSADKLTIKDRLKLFLKFEYHATWFGTIDVKDRYERQYGEEIKISTVSTYLSRLHNEGFLERRGNKVEREYKIASLEQPVEVARVQQPQLQSR